MPEGVDPFTGGDDEPRQGILGQARASFSVIALVILLVAAAASGTLGGLVATGVGGEPLERPSGFSFDTIKNETQTVTQLVIRHAGAAVPHPDRVYVVDQKGNRVPWTQVRIKTGMARVTGIRSNLLCLQQGATYRIVFEGRSITGTIAAYEISNPIPPSERKTCRKRAAEYAERQEDDSYGSGV